MKFFVFIVIFSVHLLIFKTIFAILIKVKQIGDEQIEGKKTKYKRNKKNKEEKK